LDKDVKDILYFPYIRLLMNSGEQIIRSGFKLNPHGARQVSPNSANLIFEYIKNVIFLMATGKLPLFKKNLFKVSLHNHIYNLSRIKQ
jgi:hypothetical protein